MTDAKNATQRSTIIVEDRSLAIAAIVILEVNVERTNKLSLIKMIYANC